MLHQMDNQPGPPVLDYGRPEPRRSWGLVIHDWLHEGIEQLGGPTMASVVFTLLFMSLGLRIGGPIGATSVMTAGVFFQIALASWAKSSRW